MARHTFGLCVSPFQRRLPGVLAWFLGAIVLLHAPDAVAISFDVSIGTGVLSGTAAALEISLIAGDNTDGNNTAKLTLFTTDGVLGSAASTGNVTGALPADVTMDESAGLGQVVQEVTLGNSIAFRVNLTTDFAGGLDFDRFDVFLLDPATSFTLVDTDLEGDALLKILLVGPPNLVSASVSGGIQPNEPGVTVTLTPVQVVPWPGTAPLVWTGLATLFWGASRRRWGCTMARLLSPRS